MMGRLFSLASWCMAAWVLLTWTATVEVIAVGAGISLLCAWALLWAGPVPGPWVLLHPRRLLPLARLVGSMLLRVVAANVGMARRIWTRGHRLRTGMVVVPTRMRRDGDLAAVGLLSSLVVDNQIVDLDRSSAELMYHCVDVPPEDDRYDAVNGPVEGLVEKVSRP